VSKKVIVIGAGPGGLSSAMILASKGIDVTVYEQKSYPGGRNGFISRNGFTFDIGPTFLMMLNILEDVFKMSGKELTDHVKITELEPMYRLSFDGGKKEFFPSRDHEKMKSEIEKFSPGSFEGYKKYLKDEARKYRKIFPILRKPFNSVTDLLDWELLSSGPSATPLKTLSDVIGSYYKDEYMQKAFTFQGKYIGMSPWEAPGLFSILSYVEHGGGIFHVEGGLNKISQAMTNIVQESGGKIHFNTKVSEIIVEDGTAKGVLLENGTIDRSDFVIINADFAHAMTHLVEERHRKKYNDRKIASLEYSCSGFLMYLGVDGIFDDLPHHNILFADDYRNNIDDIVKRKVISDDLSIYVQNASVVDKTVAPNGKSTLFVLVFMPNNTSGIDWEKEKGPLREKVLDKLENQGFQGLRQKIEEEVIITPTDWEKDYSVYNGAIFNISHKLKYMLYFRPHNKFEDIGSCYLVGGGTHPGSGLPTIYESGRISAELILKECGL